MNQYRFLVSYTCNNKHGIIEISSQDQVLSKEEAREYITLAFRLSEPKITDIKIISFFQPKISITYTNSAAIFNQ